jgi:hypothetical protein
MICLTGADGLVASLDRNSKGALSLWLHRPLYHLVQDKVWGSMTTYPSCTRACWSRNVVYAYGTLFYPGGNKREERAGFKGLVHFRWN